MDWEMHLYVERRGQNGWVPVCPPLPSRPKGKAKWGVYTPSDPIEAISVAAGCVKDMVPSRAPQWDFGLHTVGMQQLAAFYSFYAAPDVHRIDRETEPFLEPCGLPQDVSEQVRAAARASRLTESEGIWYTLRELKGFIFRGKVNGEPADRRVVALATDMRKMLGDLFDDTCTCKVPDCYHRDQLIRAVVWTARRKAHGV